MTYFRGDPGEIHALHSIDHMFWEQKQYPDEGGREASEVCTRLTALGANKTTVETKTLMLYEYCQRATLHVAHER